MGRLFCSASLLVVLGFGISAWADDKKDSDSKPKDYKKEFQDYTVVNNLRGKLVKVDKGQSLELEVAVNAKTNKKVDFPTLDNMEVLWVNPPVELDDKGKPKKVKPQDRKKPVTGPGGLKGYPAEPSDLKMYCSAMAPGLAVGTAGGRPGVTHTVKVQRSSGPPERQLLVRGSICFIREAAEFLARNWGGQEGRMGKQNSPGRSGRPGLYMVDWFVVGQVTNLPHKLLEPPAVAAPVTVAVAAAAAVAAGAGPLLARPGLVDGQGSALEHGPVEVGYGLVGPVRHLDEPEAARPAGVPVGNDLGRGHGAVLAERLAEVVDRGLERQVPDVQILAHHHPSLRARRRRANTDGIPPAGGTEDNGRTKHPRPRRSGRRPPTGALRGTAVTRWLTDNPGLAISGSVRQETQSRNTQTGQHRGGSHVRSLPTGRAHARPTIS